MPVDSYRLTKVALNMVSANQMWKFKDWEHPAKVFVYCPGYVATNLEGVGNKDAMIAKGALSPETSAQGILEILEGRRDSEMHKFIAGNGNSYAW